MIGKILDYINGKEFYSIDISLKTKIRIFTFIGVVFLTLVIIFYYAYSLLGIYILIKYF